MCCRVGTENYKRVANRYTRYESILSALQCFSTQQTLTALHSLCYSTEIDILTVLKYLCYTADIDSS